MTLSSIREAGRESAAGHGESGNGSVHKPDELPKGLRPDGPGSRSRRKLACNAVAYTIVFRDEARKAFLSLDSGVRTRVQNLPCPSGGLANPLRGKRQGHHPEPQRHGCERNLLSP